jgi:hypothetical protein
MSVADEMAVGACCVVCTLPFTEEHGYRAMCNWCRATGNKTKQHGAKPSVYPTVMDGEGTLNDQHVGVPAPQ